MNKKNGRIYCDFCIARFTTDKSKVGAALFAVFLGGFGAHKFYLGQIGLGVVYLLCTIPGILLFGIPTIVIGIISFVDFIILLSMSDEEFAMKYPPTYR